AFGLVDVDGGAVHAPIVARPHRRTPCGRRTSARGPQRHGPQAAAVQVEAPGGEHGEPGGNVSVQRIELAKTETCSILCDVTEHQETGGVLSAPLIIEYPFKRTTGPIIGAFLTGL